MAILLSLFMVIGLAAGCSSTSKEPVQKTEDGKTEEGAGKNEEDSTKTSGEAKHLVFVTPLIAHPVWLAAKEGFDDAAEEFGFRGDWVGPSVIDVDAVSYTHLIPWLPCGGEYSFDKSDGIMSFSIPVPLSSTRIRRECFIFQMAVRMWQGSGLL